MGGGLALLRGVLTEGLPDRHEPGPVAVWVADRDGHEVTGLDDDLFVTLRVPLRFPVDVEARADGGLWVASAPEGHPLTPHRLARLDERGCLRATASLSTFLDLSTLDGGDALVVDRDGTGRGRLRRVSADGRDTVIAYPLGAQCVAGTGTRVLVGTDRGWLQLRDLSRPRAGVIERQRVGGRVVEVTADPRGWWALATDEAGARVLRLGRELQVVWEAPLGRPVSGLAPVRGEERVWLVDAEWPRAWCLGRAGVIELQGAGLAHAGLAGCAAAPDGGVLVAAPGAVLRLDRRGRRIPGQGGFAFLVDVAVRVGAR